MFLNPRCCVCICRCVFTLNIARDKVSYSEIRFRLKLILSGFLVVSELQVKFHVCLNPFILALLLRLVGTLSHWMSCGIGRFFLGGGAAVCLVYSWFWKSPTLTGSSGSYVSVLMFSDIAQSSVTCVIVCPLTPFVQAGMCRVPTFRQRRGENVAE